jgi:hypothetical protein
MKTYRRRKTARRDSESGQALVFMVLALSLFLLGAGALCVDMSNLWFHRQAAQNAADAACTAGAMDILVQANGGATGTQPWVTAGTAFNCTTGSTAAPCQYAAKNGYNSDGTGNLVSVSFPGTVTGVPTSAIPPSALVPKAFMRVDVTDNVSTFFSGVLSGQRSQTVRSFAACGVVLATAPIPILVLDPHNPDKKTSALDIQGNPTITIVGGPAKSIQVNSDSKTAANVGGSALIDLSGGGTAGTGSDIGVYGSTPEPSVPKNFNPGTTGHWSSPASPIGDPFTQLAAPGKPAAGTMTVVGKGTDGCIDSAGCAEYTAGDYPGGICVGNPCKGDKHETAIFQTGIYYIEGDFSADANSCLRPSTVSPPSPNNIGGMLFYFQGTSATNVNVDSNSGSKCPSTFSTTTGAGPFVNGIKCTATSVIPSNLSGTSLTGNVLLGPCTGPYGDSLVAATGSPDPILGVQRGILFFQAHGFTGKTQSWGGGGSFLLAGTMYFHSDFSDSFHLQGNSGSTTYVFGDIVADNLQLGGSSGITMDLNPVSAFTQLKATLVR